MMTTHPLTLKLNCNAVIFKIINFLPMYLLKISTMYIIYRYCKAFAIINHFYYRKYKYQRFSKYFLFPQVKTCLRLYNNMYSLKSSFLENKCC